MITGKSSNHIPSSVIFVPMNYRVYIESAAKLNIINISNVDDYLLLDNCDLSIVKGLILNRSLNDFYELCSELMNVNCEHGFYRPSALDIRRLLSWQETTRLLQNKIGRKICFGNNCHG
ncbi:hypothetical protein K9Y57_004799 [Salmonella enterica]|nr:hypothetical protein [Salmonella enterica]